MPLDFLREIASSDVESSTCRLTGREEELEMSANAWACALTNDAVGVRRLVGFRWMVEEGGVSDAEVKF